ncbi:RNA polymerase II transcription factor B subunit 2, putative [Plasmodium gallinaceum]|uniref:General transcription factor IIH subunit 4 n=1 Tax=Plasmodium gallinaceum TaxID=5849 RepID=A0A1J1H1A0_PLAGA|nr:RNA polymerase II transcription factor B subunit 2, putative [Plasmodium gallinaceum]CRG97069.1 RNA polymerase II transcription factor B subunit 2, putative [Plasmodium gallinaceum]
MVKIRKNVENMEIYDYMKDLNENIWEYFFDDSLAHETIFHSLNELEQIIISRLLFIQQVVSERAMRLWINPHFLKNLSEGIKNLVDAKILIGSDTKKDNYSQYKINDKFRYTLLNKIYKFNENNIFIFNYNIKEQIEKEKNLYENNLFPTKEEIFSYAQTKWNNLLHFIASPKMNNLNSYVICNNNNNEENNYANTDYLYSSSFKNDDINKNKSLYKLSYNTFKKNEKKDQDEEEYYENYEDDQEDEEEEMEEEEEEEEEEEYKRQEDQEEENQEDEQEIHSEEDNKHEKKEKSKEYYDYEKENNNYIYKDNYIGKCNDSNINKVNNENVNQYDYYMRRKKKKKKNIYAYKQNELYYKSLQNRENSYMDGEENSNSIFCSHEKDTSYIPCDSVIEVLKRKKFILDDSNNNKAISMSREAFSWFLKDLRSRIISLVLEYLLIIDDGNVTNIAQEVSVKYKKKNNVDNSNSSHVYDKDKNDSFIDDSYITKVNKDPKKSEIYVKETLLLILSISQCDISQPIFLDNLTKSQKEFVDFGMHIGLFYKPNENYVFITPYALLLTINNTNTQHYLSLLSNMTVEGLGNDKFKKKLYEKYFHSYLLLQEQKQMMDKSLEEKDAQMIDKNKITNNLINEGLYYEKKMNENNNLEIGLIVQSNFKVYLYTSSLLKINILSHLCELQARTPNMVVGILTRRSVLNAYNSDITANQIIKFLESYSHPCKNNFKNPIPINVITQLKLWESERHRLTFEDAIVFKTFEKEFLPYLYQQIVIWANSKNYLLYYTPWPKNNTKEFDVWLKSEKYLCCIYESKNEIIDKIKEIREKLIKKRQKP